MKRQPDKLFHSKIKDFEKAPPSHLWDRIDSGLEAKKKRIPFLSVAAAITTLIISAYFLLEKSGNVAQDERKVAIANKSMNAAEEKPSGTIDSAQVTHPPISIENTVKSNEASAAKSETKAIERTRQSLDAKREASVSDLTEQVDVSSLPDTIPGTTAIAEHIYDHPRELAYKPQDNSDQKDTSITLVFTAEETEEYLDKKEAFRATSTEKKSSTLQKLLKKAADLSTNQDPFGDLRQKKNEILALSFKSDKQRGQK